MVVSLVQQLRVLPAFCEMLFMHRALTIIETMWSLTQIHNFSYDELLDMMPWEFEGITALVSNHLETQEMKRKQAEMQR